MKALARTKIFDGKRYKLHRCWHEKEAVEKIAIRLKKKGYLARVIEVSKWIPTYCVYKRNSS